MFKYKRKPSNERFIINKYPDITTAIAEDTKAKGHEEDLSVIYSMLCANAIGGASYPVPGIAQERLLECYEDIKSGEVL